MSHGCLQQRLSDGLLHLAFDSLCLPGFRHGVFGRPGGVSPHPWRSLNVGLGVGDRPENVAANRQRLKEALGLPRLVSLGQVHGAGVLVLRQAPDDDREIPGFDALVTDLAGVGIMIQGADCQAVFLLDPVRQAVGLAHAGWRGSVAGILPATVAAMVEAFGSRPADLLAAIGPSLGPCCAEFRGFRDELPASFWPYRLDGDRFDFWAISAGQLTACGLAPSRIACAGVCTVCDQDFFSFRRDRQTGRCAAVVGRC
ncbi:MAG: peptidoglycan editing factor PgeF [Thermodesulfobacteriota bacterium]